jgi:predicted acetyltransferase
MREIRKLISSDIDDYADVAYNAYPSFKDFTKASMNDYKIEALEVMNNDPIVTFFGLFEEGHLIGVMRLFDFEMNAFGKIIPVAGLGFLGVHLMHKKKGVARALIEYYETHYKNKKIPLSLLLPFRPDFYNRMGYGFGTKMNQYRIPSEFLPKYETSNMRYLTEKDLNIILTCHDKVVENSHGRIRKFGDEIRDLFGDEYNRVVGYFENAELKGYIVYKFRNAKEGNYTINQIYIKELIHIDVKAFRNLMGYLKHQQDQVELIIFNTEDEHFHQLFSNPLNDTKNYIPYGYLETNTQAIGVMYKVLDVRAAFKQLEYRDYNHVKLKVKFSLLDDYTAVSEDIIVHFDNSAILAENDFDVVVTLKQSHFSSLFLNCTSIKGLYDLGLIELNDDTYLRQLDLLFYYDQKPVCYTDF